MADEDIGQERSESPTEERREKFRKKGEVVHSREVTSVLVLGILVAFLSFYVRSVYIDLYTFMTKNFHFDTKVFLTTEETFAYFRTIATLFLKITLPIFAAGSVTAILVTLIQTRFNFSFDRLQFDLSKLNPIQGVQRIISWQAIVETVKGFGKIIIISVITGCVLYSEAHKFPFLMNVSLGSSWSYWLDKSKFLFIMILIFLLLLGGFDYLYSYIVLENKMKMSRQMLREEYKEREVDPNVKQRLRRMQKEIATRKTMESTRKATVLITNPTHYAIAIRYEVGMVAPVMIAKGMDHLALQMRELATSLNIPIVENKPLAQTLYKTLKVDQEIPSNLYKALSEIISYVFKIKGIRIRN